MAKQKEAIHYTVRMYDKIYLGLKSIQTRKDKDPELRLVWAKDLKEALIFASAIDAENFITNNKLPYTKIMPLL